MVNKPLRRPEMLGKDFFCEGDGEQFPSGRWRVRQIVGNEYRCDRMSGDDNPHGKHVENFDGGYVHRAHEEGWQHLREQGPKWFARYHTDGPM